MYKMKTKITFKKDTDTRILVLREGKEVGQIYSELSSGSLPFPHDEHECTKEKIQICGFDTASEVWSCGVIHGKKDITLRFADLSDDFHKTYRQRYIEYVNYLTKNDKLEQIKSFYDWCMHDGYPKSGVHI